MSLFTHCLVPLKVDGKKEHWKECLLINEIPLFGSLVREEGKIILDEVHAQKLSSQNWKVATKIQINKIPKITLLLMD
jgi:hypothetical protein